MSSASVCLSHTDAWAYAMSRCPWPGRVTSAPIVRSSSTSTSHSIEPMADPSWCIRHCTLVLCVGIMGASQLLSNAPSGHGIAPMTSLVGSSHKAETLSCLRGENVNHTKPHAVAATECIPHISWSPCVHARVPSVCHRHTQGCAMVSPWCGQSPALVPP